MSIQICRAVEVMMRPACCKTISSRCLRKAVLACGTPSGPCVPGAHMLQKRAYSLDTLSSGPGRPTLGQSTQQAYTERTPPSSGVTHRNLSAVAVQEQRRPPCLYNFLDVGEIEQHTRFAEASGLKRFFIVDPDLAKRVAQYLEPEDAKTVILECDPGPAVLTRALLNAGAQKIVALEGKRFFLHQLQQLEGCLDGQLKVVHCDFFKLDPLGIKCLTPSMEFSDTLFNDLGISESSWTDDITVKIVGIIPHHRERNALLRLITPLYEQQSIFRYGRIELNFFMSEREYLKLVTPPGQFVYYGAFSVLCQLACDVELLHKEPWDSFMKKNRPKIKKHVGRLHQLPNDNLCLVRLRPRADLFSAGLTPSNAPVLVMMIKQCLTKRKAKLIDYLNVWSPDCGSKLLFEMGMPKDILTGQVYPEQYLRLFQLMEKSEEFTQSWLFGETQENKRWDHWV